MNMKTLPQFKTKDLIKYTSRPNISHNKNCNVLQNLRFYPTAPNFGNPNDIFFNIKTLDYYPYAHLVCDICQ